MRAQAGPHSHQAPATSLQPSLPWGVAPWGPDADIRRGNAAAGVGSDRRHRLGADKPAPVSLARRYLGLPFVALSLNDGPKKQLLAVSNSRKWTPRTSGEHLSQHVQRLRYLDGEVDYCQRQHYFSHWAEAAERNGCGVNLTPFLPGASSRTVALNLMSNHVSSHKPMQLARNKLCITELEKDLVVNQPYIPLAALTEVLPSLRNGDMFALVTKVSRLDVTHLGFLEKHDGVIDAIRAAEGWVGGRVIRRENFEKYAGRVPDVIGAAIYRPRPNPVVKLGG